MDTDALICVAILVVLAGGAPHNAAAQGLAERKSRYVVGQQELEKTLSAKSADPLWPMAIYSQAVREIEQACAARLQDEPVISAGTAFQRMAERFLRPSGRSTVEVMFISCPGRLRLTALSLGATIVVSRSWLERATEEDLWAVAAHEMAHRPADFPRRIVIEHHLPAISPEVKARLQLDIEVRADCGAIILLKPVGKQFTALEQFLKKENQSQPSAEVAELRWTPSFGQIFACP